MLDKLGEGGPAPACTTVSAGGRRSNSIKEEDIQ